MKTNTRVQAAIDRLVKAANKGKKPRPEDIALAIEGWDGDVLGNTDFIAVGIRLENVEPRLSDQQLSDYDGRSLDEITNPDRIAYARQLLVRETSEYDSDFSPAFRGAEIKSTEGAGALLVFSVTGYSFSGVSLDCYGAFRSLHDFKAGAHDKGYILSFEISDVDDTRRWVSDTQILEAWNE
jgi:hypothetical protein